MDPGSYYRREGDANRGGSVEADQNRDSTAEDPGHLQRGPAAAAPLLPREAGKQHSCATAITHRALLQGELLRRVVLTAFEPVSDPCELPVLMGIHQ